MTTNYLIVLDATQHEELNNSADIVYNEDMGEQEMKMGLKSKFVPHGLLKSIELTSYAVPFLCTKFKQ